MAIRQLADRPVVDGPGEHDALIAVLEHLDAAALAALDDAAVGGVERLRSHETLGRQFVTSKTAVAIRSVRILRLLYRLRIGTIGPIGEDPGLAQQMSSPVDTSVAPTHDSEDTPFRTKHPVRLITATSLFDGHDASINIFRRIAQACRRRGDPPRTQPIGPGDRLRGDPGGRSGDRRDVVPRRPQRVLPLHEVDLLDERDCGHDSAVRRRRRHDPAGGDRGAARLR